MFSAIWNRIKEMLQKLIGPKTVEKALHITPIISSKMAEAIELWGKMYTDEAPWLHEPDYADKRLVESMNLAAQISSEKARMVVLELNSTITAPTETITEDNPNYVPPAVNDDGFVVKSEEPKTITKEKPVTPTERAEFLNEQFDKVRKKIRTELEYGIAMGGLVIKPYVVVNDTVSDGVPTQTSTLEFDFIHADGFFPLAFDGSGNVTEAAFIQTKTDKTTTYTRLEHHKLEGTTVIIENRAFKSENITQQNNIATDLGQEIPLSEVPEWKDLEPESTINNVDRLLFAYFKMPDANTVDTHSPLGVSGYSRAVKLIKQADLQYSRILWEFEAGEMAIDVDRDALVTGKDDEDKDISLLPHTQQRLYRRLDIDGQELYQVFAPALRDSSLFNGLNQLLMRIEDVCSISRGTISEVNSEARTATELKILKQRSYSANADIQEALEDTFRDVIYIMDVYCTLYDMVGDAPINSATGTVDTSKMGRYEASFEWDDSILTDVDTELSKRINLMTNGLASKVETRMWYFGETEQQAREALQKINNEGQEDVETEMLNQAAFAKRKK